MSKLLNKYKQKKVHLKMLGLQNELEPSQMP